MMGTLSAENVTFQYGKRTVVDDVSLRLSSGQVLGLVGPSGSGKTTLLWLLAGLLPPQRGRVVIECDGSSAVRPRLGMVFQQPGLWEHLDAQEHLELVLSSLHLARPERQRRIASALEEWKLQSLRRRLPRELSGGERQRLAIARATVLEPQWLLLDEPGSNLDVQAWEHLPQYIERARRRGAGIILSTHRSEEILGLADRLAVLIDGRLAQLGTSEEVYRRPVSLEAAVLLGPAAELSGLAQAGVLRGEEGTVLLENLDASLQGTVRLILRPEGLLFVPDDTGSWRLTSCQTRGAVRWLHLEAGRQTLHATGSAEVGAVGRLQCRP